MATHACTRACVLTGVAVQDEELARQLVELGYRGSGETLKREEFEARKKAERERHVQKQAAPKQLASANKDFTGKPFLQALANREELVRNGKLTVRAPCVPHLRACARIIRVHAPPHAPAAVQTIIFIRDRNHKGQEVSGYIDYAHRLKAEAFEPYFDGRKRLMPKPSDLSYYNWETQASTSNSSPNFQVITDNESGLLFKNKRDRKIINVDPKVRRRLRVCAAAHRLTPSPGKPWRQLYPYRDSHRRVLAGCGV